MVFRDRSDAGRTLAARLAQYTGREDVLVLALPRGGVPVGYEIAQALQLPLDVFVVRKLGTPGQPELAMGAIASGGVLVVNRDVVDTLGIPDYMVREAAEMEQRERERRERQYRGDRPPLNVQGRTVILVDDGLATGSTMRAAAAALKQQQAARIVVAVPVAAPQTCEQLRAEVDEMICAATPEPFLAVGQWYRDFSQTSDDEVRELLERAAESRVKQS